MSMVNLLLFKRKCPENFFVYDDFQIWWFWNGETIWVSTFEHSIKKFSESNKSLYFGKEPALKILKVS